MAYSYFHQPAKNNTEIAVVVIPGALTGASDIIPFFTGLENDLYIVNTGGKDSSILSHEAITLQSQVDDICSFIADKIPGKVVMVGCSIGASIGIVAAGNIAGKMAGFVNIDFAPFYPPFDRGWFDSIDWRKQATWKKQYAERLIQQSMYHDVFEDYKKAKFPILLIHGTNQSSALRQKEIDAVAKGIEGLSIQAIKDTGHEPYIEDNPAFLKSLAGFISNIAGGIYI
ncbi:MAG TPA: alpha/beta hydrolase [Legionellaceae bacterium]|nr:alpha/beta hydrolase [Legionellaceae bacterium]